jgi:hypothetical protein
VAHESDTALGRWLAEQHIAMLPALEGLVDTETGLQDVLVEQHYDSMLTNIVSFMETDAGLRDILPEETRTQRYRSRTDADSKKSMAYELMPDSANEPDELHVLELEFSDLKRELGLMEAFLRPTNTHGPSKMNVPSNYGNLCRMIARDLVILRSRLRLRQISKESAVSRLRSMHSSITDAHTALKARSYPRGGGSSLVLNRFAELAKRFEKLEGLVISLFDQSDEWVKATPEP